MNRVYWSTGKYGLLESASCTWMSRVALACARKLADDGSATVRGRRTLARSATVMAPCALIMAVQISSAVMSSKSVPPVSSTNSLVGPTLASSTDTSVDSATVSMS